MFLEISQNSQENNCASLFFDKVVGLRTAILLKKRLYHRCFPVNFVEFLRTPFHIERLWWLLLEFNRGRHLTLFLYFIPHLFGRFQLKKSTIYRNFCFNLLYSHGMFDCIYWGVCTRILRNIFSFLETNVQKQSLGDVLFWEKYRKI